MSDDEIPEFVEILELGFRSSENPASVSNNCGDDLFAAAGGFETRLHEPVGAGGTKPPTIH